MPNHDYRAAPSRPSDPIDRRLRVATVLLVGLLTVCAFVASFEAVSDYAAGPGGWRSELAFIAPLLLDMMTLAGMLAGFRRSRVNQRAAYPWALVAIGTAASCVFNFVHAPVRPGAQALAVVPPLALLVLAHLLLQELRGNAVKVVEPPISREALTWPYNGAPDPFLRSSVPRPEAKPTPKPEAKAKTNGHRDPPSLMEAKPYLPTREALREALRKEGDSLDAAAFAKRAGVSVRRVQQLLVELRGESVKT